jgi:hypothetical protein
MITLFKITIIYILEQILSPIVQNIQGRILLENEFMGFGP